MNILERILSWIKALFGKAPLDRRASGDNVRFDEAYQNTEKVNFAAVFAGALANKVMSDSTVSVATTGGAQTARTELIGAAVQQVWGRGKKVVAQALGKGGKVLIPYVSNGRLLVSTADQSRLVISGMDGDEITSASVLAESVKVDRAVYYRWIDYTLQDGVETIRNRVTTETGAEAPADSVPAWAGLAPEIKIGNVEHSLFALLKSPVDNREDKDAYGVPITYGCDDVIAQLHECLKQIREEYQLKRAFVGADSRLFGKDSQLPGGVDGKLIYKLLNPNLTGGEDMFTVFDPAIRDSSYYARYKELCALLEKQVGTARGILTEPETAGATATEIKSAQYATYCMVDDIRTAVEAALTRLAYAADVLAEFYGLSPQGAAGDYALTFDWDWSLFESSVETFSQLSELESRNLLPGWKLTAWVTGQDPDAAKADVEEAKQAAPSVEGLLAGTGVGGA